MTFKNLKTSIGFLSIIGLLVFTSCENNNDTLTEELTTEEVLNVALADDLSSDVNDVLSDDEAEGGFSSKSEVVSKSSASRKHHPDCAERTVEDTADGKIVTIDFGTGCEGKRGKIFAGKIIIEYKETATEKSKTVSFENFSIDENTVEGGKSVVKIDANGNGNPEATHSVDITVTLTTGEVLTKKGTKIREKIEGSDTDDRGDDVYSISGSWESVNKEGIVKNATITTNLRREWACKYIVSGVIEITKDGATSTLDFGDGSCDNVATLTDANGESKEITLKKRRRKK